MARRICLTSSSVAAPWIADLGWLGGSLLAADPTNGSSRSSRGELGRVNLSSEQANNETADKSDFVEAHTYARELSVPNKQAASDFVKSAKNIGLEDLQRHDMKCRRMLISSALYLLSKNILFTRTHLPAKLVASQ
jgi:hypothetical protein